MHQTNLSIAQNAKLLPITQIAGKLKIKKENLIPYGNHIAKVHINQLSEIKKEDGKLILITAITPTKEGEGKTTVTIGIAQALAELRKNVMICIRQSSMGPVFGIKGGACGGGNSQVLPMEDINLHFTGDIHAVTMAGNLLSAVIDNSITNGNPLNLDINNILWRRSIDMNDRTLRNIYIGCNDTSDESLVKEKVCIRQEHFDITAASEIMAILSLATDYQDLKARLGKIILGFSKEKKTITADDLHIQGAMAAILKNAIHPNLVQSVEYVPAFIHGGAFGNVAHGCSSLIATKMALKLADYVVTEAGFGADLGAEKFFDIKCRTGFLNPSAVVIVSTVKALKMHGQGTDIKAIENGLENLEKQIENIRKFNIEPLVTINKFHDDKEEEFNVIIKKCDELSVKAFVIDVWSKGGKGALGIAEELIKITKKENKLKFLYDTSLSIKEKIEIIAKEMYGAAKVSYTDSAISQIHFIERLSFHQSMTGGKTNPETSERSERGTISKLISEMRGGRASDSERVCPQSQIGGSTEHFDKNNFDKMPICVAKTQKSLSDNPLLLGRPQNFEIIVTKIKVCAGAGFIVVYLGDILTMPGLPKAPAALGIDIDDKGVITGLF